MLAIDETTIEAMRERRANGERLPILAGEIGISWQKLDKLMRHGLPDNARLTLSTDEALTRTPAGPAQSLTKQFSPAGLGDVLGQPRAVAVLRAFTAVPMHALASGMMGYYVGQAKFATDQRQERVFFRKGLWAAICIHGLYDFIIFASPDVYPLLGFSIFPLLIVVFFMLRKKIKLAIAEDIRAGHGIIAPPPLPDDENMSYGERET